VLETFQSAHPRRGGATTTAGDENSRSAVSNIGIGVRQGILFRILAHPFGINTFKECGLSKNPELGMTIDPRLEFQKTVGFPLLLRGEIMCENNASPYLCSEN
jgi:hypothetical protein